MRFLILTLLFLGSVFAATAQPNDRDFLSDQQSEALLWEYLEQYSPQSYFLMKDYVALPNRFEFGNTVMTLSKMDDIMFWVGSPTPEGIREDIGTVVHESNHGYTDSKAYQLIAEQLGEEYEFGASYSAFYIHKEQVLLIKHLDVINSHKIAKDIPKELRTFRFIPYISPVSPLLGSQKDGIYGLMDEWCSYMNGTRTHVDLYEYYEAHPRPQGNHFTQWIQEVAGTHFAYLEFKYFILRYLLRVKEDNPQMYRGYLQQPELLEAFFAVDVAFAEVVAEFYEKKGQIEEELRTEGLEVVDDGEFFMVQGSGVGTYENDYNLLAEELQKPIYTQLIEEMREAQRVP
ncbi:MAG TPA: hypothetical protein DCE41_17045 [Cytophagales bacterium]|nr:hypothetical protein [Cytophagales bacterium]HAA20106.1 hypothetical protein [Cytophagales bacterium]HAP64088.1 hypothetical protein [Cytophagales bacterium]